MRTVVIEMRSGQPVVISKPRNVEIVFRKQKRRSLKKRLRTLLFRLRRHSA